MSAATDVRTPTTASTQCKSSISTRLCIYQSQHPTTNNHMENQHYSTRYQQFPCPTVFVLRSRIYQYQQQLSKKQQGAQLEVVKHQIVTLLRFTPEWRRSKYAQSKLGEIMRFSRQNWSKKGGFGMFSGLGHKNLFFGIHVNSGVFCRSGDLVIEGAYLTFIVPTLQS